MNQLRIVLGRHVIRQGDVSPDPLTYRPLRDRPTYMYLPTDRPFLPTYGQSALLVGGFVGRYIGETANA